MTDVGIDRDLLAILERLDTASLSDALDSLGLSGGLLGIGAQVPGTRVIGYAFTVRYHAVDAGSTFKNAANYIDDVPSGAVIAVANGGRLDCTVWGDIMTHVAISKRITGTIIDGAARDVGTIRDLRYPLFSRGVFMQSGKNRVQLEAVQVPIELNGVLVAPGDLLFGDANGCVAIPRSRVADVAARATAVEATEAKILAAVQAGARLEEARRSHRYDQPWMTQNEKG